MNNFLLEIACFSAAGALSAEKAGADRIELCENPEAGGTTPSYGTLKSIRKKIGIPVFPMIRPRGGDFLYSEDEFAIMQQDVRVCRELGFEGVVIGILLKDGGIDVARTSWLVEAAYPMDVTFHRGFDRCADPLKSLEAVINTGCQRILTSGQFPIAIEGSSLIKALIKAADQRITIIAGSGVNSKNILTLANQTGCCEFHASARMVQKSLMNFTVDTMKETLSYISVNEAEVKEMKLVLSQVSRQVFD